MRTRNKIALAVGTAGVAALVVWALRAPPISVELAQVERGVFEQAVSDDGKTRVRERYTVFAPLAGRIERIRLKAGDPVERAGKASRDALHAARKRALAVRLDDQVRVVAV